MNTLDIEKAGRWFAVEYNNRAWELIGKKERSAEETELMIHYAHASLLHWKETGTRINELRAYYLLTYAYATAEQGSPALRYADHSLALQQDEPEGMADWDVAFIYDAAARAYAVSGEADAALQYRQRAADAAELIADEEDRRIFRETFR